MEWWSWSALMLKFISMMHGTRPKWWSFTQGLRETYIFSTWKLHVSSHFVQWMLKQGDLWFKSSQDSMTPIIKLLPWCTSWPKIDNCHALNKVNQLEVLSKLRCKQFFAKVTSLLVTDRSPIRKFSCFGPVFAGRDREGNEQKIVEDREQAKQWGFCFEKKNPLLYQVPAEVNKLDCWPQTLIRNL